MFDIVVIHKTTTNGCLTVCGQTRLDYNTSNSWDKVDCPLCLKFKPKWVTPEYIEKMKAVKHGRKNKRIL